MDKVICTPLKKIPNPKGDIYHVLKATDDGYSSFGEAYFTSIHFGQIKGWKKHNVMQMNLIVPVGLVRFYFFDEHNLKKTSFVLGESNYCRLTVKPGVWVAFEGVGENFNLILNLADVLHDPSESSNLPLESISLCEFA